MKVEWQEFEANLMIVVCDSESNCMVANDDFLVAKLLRVWRFLDLERFTQRRDPGSSIADGLGSSFFDRGGVRSHRSFE